MKKTALIIIDIQQDYFKDGRFELVNPEEGARQTRRLLEFFRAHSLPVVHVQQVLAEVDAPLLQFGTPGVGIHPLVAPIAGETVVTKSEPNSFLHTRLIKVLRTLEVERLVMTGMTAHGCLNSSVRAAQELGFEVIVPAEATASRNLEFEGELLPAEIVTKATLSALGLYFAQIISTDQLLQQLESNLRKTR